MYAFSKPLGDAAKTARNSLRYTQAQVADLIDVEVRTVMFIENCKANPRMTVLYPLIRALRIDANDIFHPEAQPQQMSPAMRQMCFLLEDCTDQELAALTPIVQSVLSVLRSENGIQIPKP